MSLLGLMLFALTFPALLGAFISGTPVRGWVFWGALGLVVLSLVMLFYGISR